MHEAIAVETIQSFPKCPYPEFSVLSLQQTYNDIRSNRVSSRRVCIQFLFIRPRIPAYQPGVIGTQPQRTVITFFQTVNISQVVDAKLKNALIVISHTFLISTYPHHAAFIFIKHIDGIIGQTAFVIHIIRKRDSLTSRLIPDIDAILVLPKPNTPLLILSYCYDMCLPPVAEIPL